MKGLIPVRQSVSKRDFGALHFFLDNPQTASLYSQAMSTKAISEAARILGRKGGKVKSDAKTKACRMNAKRPRKRTFIEK